MCRSTPRDSVEIVELCSINVPCGPVSGLVVSRWVRSGMRTAFPCKHSGVSILGIDLPLRGQYRHDLRISRQRTDFPIIPSDHAVAAQAPERRSSIRSRSDA